jgi:hypothetical protein
MRRFAVAVNAGVSGADHYNEAMVHEFAKPEFDVVAVAVPSKLFLSVTR